MVKLEIHADSTEPVNPYIRTINIATAIIDFFVDSTARLDGFDELKELNEYLSVFIKNNEDNKGGE